MKLFNMDLHISVLADFKNLFPEFDITNWNLSGHSWVFNKIRDNPKYINSSSWINLNEEMILNFQTEYDDLLKTFDGFICGHPNGFIPIYEKYNKPIIMINTCRYDLPFCCSKNYKMLKSYNECLKRLQEKKLLIAISNNKADKYYTQFGSSIETYHIPSLCAYTGIKYNPTKTTFLCYSGDFPTHNLITNKSELGNKFKWDEISKFKGVIHLPYEISTMSMFEHYSGGMPLFFPTKKYMMDKVDIQSISAYWKSELPKELSVFSDKNVWIELADFYQVFKSPNVYYYNSFEHLIELLINFQWKDDSDILDKYRKEIKNDWIKLLSNNFSIFKLTE